MPSLLEYLSYNCNFMGILAGPTCSYNDYIAFIEGRSYHAKHLQNNGKVNGTHKQSDPSPKVSPPLPPSRPLSGLKSNVYNGLGCAPIMHC